MTEAARPQESAIREALRTVYDPEVGENIVDLGLVYRVETRPGAVDLDITMTTPACPAAGSIAEEAGAAVRRACPEGTRVRVEVVFDPPWTPEYMSADVKRRFGW
ncbi:MAG: metal-sulfur cluster assembly factor [Burkholderiales bacterium]|nr:metal-sulfur cluster assembly factor [Burkholderiales bacterium]